MNAKILIGAGASVIAIAALIVAGQGFTAARRAERARAAIVKNEAALATSRAAARASSEAEPASPATSGQGNRATVRAKPPSVASLLAADPKLMALYLKSFRASLPDRYGATYARLGLPPAVISRFEELRTGLEGDIMDIQGAAEAQGLANDDPGIAAMRRQANQEYEAKLTALILEAGISITQATAENRLANSNLQGMMLGLATATALSPAPMTYAQLGQLGPILAAASPNFQKTGSIDRMAIDWDKAVPEAAKILTPDQLENFQMQATVTKIQAEVKQFHDQVHPAAAP